MEQNPWAKAFASLNQVDNAATYVQAQNSQPPPPPPSQTQQSQMYQNSGQFNLWNNFFPCANQWNGQQAQGSVYNPPPPPSLVLPSSTVQPTQPYNYTPTYASVAHQQLKHPASRPAFPPHSVAPGVRGTGPVSFKIPKKSQQPKQPSVVSKPIPRPPPPPSAPTSHPSSQNVTKQQQQQYRPQPSQPQYVNNYSGAQAVNNNQSQQSNNKNMFPPELQDYCNRAYQLAKTDLERDRMEIILKGKITKVFKDGGHVDWSKEPLPQLASSANFHSQPASIPKPPPPPSPAHKPAFKSSSSTSPPKKSDDKLGYFTKNLRKRHSESSEDDYIPLAGNKKFKSEDILSGKRGKKVKKKLLKQMAQEEKLRKSSQKGLFGVVKQAERRARFEDYNRKTNENDGKYANRIALNAFTDVGDNDFDLSSVEAIVGTATKLEKRYLRLTSAPDPSTVRPLEILRQSLNLVRQKWAETRDYSYACDQLKSIRQDITVQCIRCEFAVEAYETAARIAIQGNDYSEFSQCQGKLTELYAHPTLAEKCVNRKEFVAYQILYHISSKNERGLQTVLKSLSDEDKKNSLISFALKVRSSWSLGDYHGIFRLYKRANELTRLVMDWFIERERTQALYVILKAYRPSVTTQWLMEEFAFDDRTQFEEFIAKFPIVYDTNIAANTNKPLGKGSRTTAAAAANKDVIDCKNSHFSVQAQRTNTTVQQQ